MFAALAQDLRVATRVLVREPAFALVAVIALGLGIGVNNTLFTILNAFCFRGLPIEEPDRVVYVALQDAEGRSHALSFPELEELQAARSLATVAGFAQTPASLRDEDRSAERVRRAYISATGFRLLGEAPVVGRDFRPEDDRPGATPVAILGAGIWKARYAGDPTIVGRTVTIDGVPTAVIGVMADDFGFPESAELWQPLAAMPGIRERRDARALGVAGRLAPHAAIADARAELEAIGTRWTQEHRATNERMRMSVVPINERYLQRVTHPAWLAFGITGLLVVAIACANVANLLLARSVTRAREVAIRASLGATRRRIIRQLLAESAVLAVAGGLVGFVVSLAGVALFDRAIPATVRVYLLHFAMDGVVFSVLAAVCLGTVFLFGLVPALHLSSASSSAALREGGRGGFGSRRTRRWTAAFLTVEFALTMMLLARVGDTVRTHLARERADRVFDASRLATMFVTLPPTGYPDAPRRATLYDALEERLSHIGAISGSALATALPLGGGVSRPVEIDGVPDTATRPLRGILTVGVSDGYFTTLGVALRAGRSFTAVDGTPGHAHAIVNERFAAAYLRGEAVGRRIRLHGPGGATSPEWLTIVGVAPSVRQRPVTDPDPVVYVPLRADAPATAALIVRAPSDPTALIPIVRTELRALDTDLPLHRALSMEESSLEYAWNTRLSTTAITTISAIALCLSLVGLYAVTAHAVAQRTPEIGVRIALGARPAAIGWLVLRRALTQLAAGVGVGVLCTIAWGKLFGSAAAFQPESLAIVVAAVAAVAMAACLAPARRAMRIDPVEALRFE